MAVYVDDAIWHWKGRKWCHLLADDEAEATGLMEIMNRKGGQKTGSEWVTAEGLDEADEFNA